MSDNNFPDIIGVVFFFLLMALYWFYLGHYAFKAYAYTVKKRPDIYRKWGVAIEPHAPTTVMRSIAGIVGIAAGISFTTFVAYITSVAFVDVDRFMLIFSIASVALLSGLVKEQERIKGIE